MKKILSAVIFSVMLCASLAGCGSNSGANHVPDTEGYTGPAVVTGSDASGIDNGSDAVSEHDKTKEEQGESADTTSSADAVAVSDNLYDYGFELDGKTYTLPFAYTDLAAAGWKVKNDDTETVPAMSRTLSDPAKNGASSVTVALVNPYRSEKTYEQCRVASISVDEFSFRKGENHSFSIAGGISFDSTEDDVRAAFGEPTRIYDGSTLITLYYEEMGDSFHGAEITFHRENGAMYEIKLVNIIAEDLPDNSEVHSNEMAASYTAPKTLGDSYDSFAFMLYDDIFSMPAPVSYYVEKGWQPVNFSVDDTMDGSESAYGFKLRKNGQTMTVSCENYIGDVCTLSDCFVVELTVGGSFYGEIPVTLGGGISVGSDLEDAVNAWGTPSDSKSASGYTSTTFGTYGSRVVISSDDATGKIISVNIQNYEPRS